MDITQILSGARESMTVQRVFGEAYERDGAVVIPVARLSGGGGGGEGGSEHEGQGAGTGFGMRAEPAGVYVIQDGTVRWEPAVDVNRIVIGLQVVVLALLVVLRAAVKRTRKRKR
jgi:uncharacterized spore protein YtfJ